MFSKCIELRCQKSSCNALSAADWWLINTINAVQLVIDNHNFLCRQSNRIMAGE
jgi:hypothetical protein